MLHDTSIRVLRQRPAATARACLEGAPPGQCPVRSLYIHVPFCFHKCHYCDFYSLVDTRDRQGPFVDRLSRELAALAPWAAGAPLRTIFVGGGTPSLLRPELWEQLLGTLRRDFDLSLMGSGAGEFTVECNPETVTSRLMAVLVAGGVNRVSMGAQSFHPAHLTTLERWHHPENVPRALETARGAGIRRRSIDLIFGIPGQTLGDWGRDLGAALACGTEHLSCYNLTYEAGTAMTARLGRGEFAPADEDLEVDMYALTLRTLRSAGMERYEVSNYAAPGAEARHNLAYWRQEQWLAAGTSASAHVAGRRWKNAPRLDDYLGTDDGGFAPVIDFEAPDAARALRESIMTRLRLAEGVDPRELLRGAGGIDPGAPPALERVAAGYAARGLLLLEPARWRLTDAGFLIADAVAADLMGAVG
jgi:oxygen-independent coproporphyrinogen-3 oxidase